MSTKAQAGVAPAHRPWWQRRWLQVSLALCVLLALGLVLAAEYVLHHAEPILRKRIVETLSARFGAPVTLDRVDISLFRGIEVNGYGLRILFPPGTSLHPAHAGSRRDPDPASPPTMVAVQHFAFRTSFRGLLRQPTHVALVRVDAMELHIPPPGQRRFPFNFNRLEDPDQPNLKPKIALLVEELQCRDVKLFLEPGQPGKVPLEFDIATLDLHDVGQAQAMRYDAVLTNPKPRGLIHAVGHFGPWANAVPGGEAGQTPLDGAYTFDHADLNTIKGISGILSSTGHFAGMLDRIVIDGTTDVPEFSLDISNRPVPLHAQFHAVVDGTSGDTFLDPVRARLAGSEFTTRGKVVKTAGQGHDIQLTIDIPDGRMQDFLRLAVKTNPPLLNGTLRMQASLRIPPGNVRVPEKLAVSGAFHLTGVRFNNPKLQDRIDGFSARVQGKPRDVAEVSQNHEAEVHSQLTANFSMRHGVMSVTDVHYAIPGALVLLNGVYSLDGKLFEFKGHVRTQASASQMVTGWKSLLLKPLDSFLQKNGAGIELPVEISGTEGDVHLGLALQGTNDTPQQMLSDAKGKAHDQQQTAAARRAMAQADAEDQLAARAATVEEAERAHRAAVQHRAEAQRLLGNRVAASP